MPPVLPPMQPTVHRHWAPDVAAFKYTQDDRDWDEYVHPRQLPADHHPKTAPPKSSRASTSKAPSNKRASGADAAGAEPPKKRRKDESAPAPQPVPMSTAPSNSKRLDAHKQPEERAPVQTDLSTLPVPSLVSYLVKHDIIPPIHPSPYTAQPTLAPSILLHPPSHTPPPPPSSSSISLVPERERRRSGRFQEDELNAAGDDPTTHHVPILTDLDGVHGALAKLVERHWHTKTVREQDTIAGFVWSAQRARERTLLAASSAGHG
ncbi:hypothetical protein FRC10_002625 [Ceratobasidium sp. 414]|nr:hypothetical protein FRC10_002625 [Ceratobasidium sp. 414]